MDKKDLSEEGSQSHTDKDGGKAITAFLLHPPERGIAYMMATWFCLI
jgi:hypothetical protein